MALQNSAALVAARTLAPFLTSDWTIANRIDEGLARGANSRRLNEGIRKTYDKFTEMRFRAKQNRVCEQLDGQMWST